jgi:hypothetical protein
MTDSPNLKGLIERCEQATEGSRELDELLTAWSVGATRQEDATFDHKPAYHRDGFWVSIQPITPLTSSIDAALALSERLLPGLFCYEFGWQASALTEVSHDAQLHFTNGEPPMIDTSMAEAHTLPLAIILAILKALSRIKGDHNDEA